MLHERQLTVFEKTFPTQSAENAIAHIGPDTSAQAIVTRAKLPIKQRIAESKLDSHHLRSQILQTHSNLAILLANGYLVTDKFFGYSEARKRLLEADRVLTMGGINLSVSDDELCQIAEDKARLFELRIKCNQHTYKFYKQLCNDFRMYCVEPPKFDDTYFTVSPAERSKLPPAYRQSVMALLTGALNRMACPLWWRRRLRKKQALVIEQLARDMRTVHKKSSPYVSEFTIRRKRERNAKSEEIMNDLYVVPHDASPFDEFESLKDVAAKSSTSGIQLAAELMVRIRGFEECSKMLGHRGEFYTITAPSRFHSVHASGIPNRKYDGSTPNDAQDYFNDLWKRARALFAKAGIRPYGFRVVEPHHDGCPHWHMLLFMAKGQAVKARKILKSLALKDTPGEVRTSSTRFKAISIDKSKGSAAGYIAKYITKAVNGEHINQVTCPEAGKISIAPADAAERASTWASTFNIRRFQQIGGPSVTTWRELRRLGMGESGKCEVANSMNTNLDTVSRYALEKVRAAADASDWAAFCLAMGGVQVKRKDQAVRIHYQIPDIVDQITGEISRSESKSPYFSTKYGDMPAKRILGVAWDSVVVITRRGTNQVLSEKDIHAQRKIMLGVSESIQNWVDDGRFEQPSVEEMQFLESCVVEDYQNMCLFMDYEALSVVNSDEVALDLCH
ncbi:replication endonuclease [Pseudoalteromonas rubra]|uniref:Replication endonuclease n=1 Tax=Pseudoalteromonas rubra TaxID=43658 RepID=A0A4Q7E3V2_9GAMM|nr:replication endonuclease [Pseudoalteromonas rubra]RZM76432.1 replication endonuclease [Pseudoalteromonas rubra]